MNKEALQFRLCGNGDVFILREQIMINNMIVEEKQPRETFFSIYDDSSYYGILLPIESINDELLRLDVEIILKLQNIMGMFIMKRFHWNLHEIKNVNCGHYTRRTILLVKKCSYELMI